MESKPNICSSCNVAFISLRSLEIHLRFLHKKNNFESKKAKTICKYCSQPYSTIKKHEKRCEEFYKIFVRNETECMIYQESYTSIRKHLSAKHRYEMAQIQGSCVSMRNKLIEFFCAIYVTKYSDKRRACWIIECRFMKE